MARGEITGRKPRVTADRAIRGPLQAKPAKKVADKARESKAQQQGDDVSESESATATATAANGGTTAANEGGSAANGDAEHEPTPHGEPQSGAPNKLPPIRPPIPVAAYSITEFCQAHRLSESMYFKLRGQGLGPDEMIVGRRRMISVEAAAAWRREREQAATEAAE